MGLFPPRVARFQGRDSASEFCASFVARKSAKEKEQAKVLGSLSEVMCLPARCGRETALAPFMQKKTFAMAVEFLDAKRESKHSTRWITFTPFKSNHCYTFILITNFN